MFEKGFPDPELELETPSQARAGGFAATVCLPDVRRDSRETP